MNDLQECDSVSQYNFFNIEMTNFHTKESKKINSARVPVSKQQKKSS
jgi:hypothetical protein